MGPETLDGWARPCFGSGSTCGEGDCDSLRRCTDYYQKGVANWWAYQERRCTRPEDAVFCPGVEEKVLAEGDNYDWTDLVAATDLDYCNCADDCKQRPLNCGCGDAAAPSCCDDPTLIGLGQAAEDSTACPHQLQCNDYRNGAGPGGDKYCIVGDSTECYPTAKGDLCYTGEATFRACDKNKPDYRSPSSSLGDDDGAEGSALRDDFKNVVDDAEVDAGGINLPPPAPAAAPAPPRLPMTYCTSFRNGPLDLDATKPGGSAAAPAFFSKYGGDVCWRYEQREGGLHVECTPPTGPYGSANNGCPADHQRGEAAFVNKVYPKCTCDSSVNDAVAGRMCQKGETGGICYPMMSDYDYKKGDSGSNYGCPADMIPCVKL